ncbi:unnamed protein product [Sphagnum tenellum]
MRSILEQAIVHLLNEEQDKAEKLFHKFMVEKARRIHESLRSGEVVLAEGWDDEITSEEYMTEDDLDSIEDNGDEMGGEGDMGADDAAGELGDDMDVDAEDADMDAEDADLDAEDADLDAEDADADAEMGDDMAGEEGSTEERIDDLEDQIEKLTAEFDKMMAEMGDEGMGDDMGDMAGDEGMGDEDHMGDDEGADMGDDMGDEGDDMADQMEDDVTDPEMDSHDEMSESDDMGMEDDGNDDTMSEGKIPPQFMKNIKKKKAESKGKKKVKENEDPEGDEDKDMMEEDEDLDDITESVMAELEKICVSMEDGKEVASGKKITTNDKSPMVQVNVDKRGGAKPVTIKSVNHSGYERETAPGNKTLKKGKNTVSGKADSVLSKVPEKGDKSAKINSDYAGSAGNKRSTID